MRKLLAILTISLASLAAFAQGRLLFANDSLHLVYYNPPLSGGFGPPGGTPVSADNMPPGVSLVADLYLGTSSSALSLTTTTAFGLGSPPGEWTPTFVMTPTIPPGTTVFVKIQVRNAAFVLETVWTPGFVPPDYYWGFSVEFPFTLGSGVTYPGFGTAWPIGDYPLPGGGGARGAIPVGYTPEPSVLALVGLGAAIMLNRGIRGTRGKTTRN